MNEPVYFTEMPSAVGRLTLRWSSGGLSGIFFDNARPLRRGVGGDTVPPREREEWIRDDARFSNARTQLEEYFRGERTRFDLELVMIGTPFQCLVWNALRTIPYGETTSYGALARQIDKPEAVRAVGAANGQNPFVIVVPCHRVIGADGSLVGFGGGLPRKRWLLALEGSLENGRTKPLFPSHLDA